MSVKQVFNTSAELDYPTVLPTLDLDFANSKTLDPRITFTRASGGSYTGADGLIKLAGVNEPRFDHDPTTGESLGLLVEEGRSNLLTDSAGNFNYSFNNQIIPTANDVAPDGTTVLCKHDLTGSFASLPFLNCRANTTLSAGTYTMSMYLKGTTSFSGAFAFVGETNNEIYFNTANITTTWQRFTLTFTLLATSTLSRLQLFFNTQGNGKVVSVWGAQLEAGSFATTYIARSSGAQATRAADDASITGRNFSSFYRQDEGTIYSNINFYDATGNVAGYKILQGASLRGLGVQYTTSGTSFVARTITGGFYAVDGPLKSKKVAGRYKIGYSVGASIDGSGPVTSFSTSEPVFGTESQMDIGGARSLSGSNNKFNGTINRITYYNRYLPLSQLQTLTS